MAQTAEDTGLPGRPSTGVPRRARRTSAACPAAWRSSRNRAPGPRRRAPSARGRARRPRRRRWSPAGRRRAAARSRAIELVRSSRRSPRSTGSPPQARDQGGEGRAVGADDLRRPDRLAGQADLVAGRQDADARPAAHRQPGHGSCAAARPMSRAVERRPAARPISPGAEVEAAAADMRPRWRRLGRTGTRAAVGLGVLLDDDGIGAGGQAARR